MSKKYGVDKSPATYEEYIFNVSDKYKEIAKNDLREDENVRNNALKQMREWIAKHPNIKRCRTDAGYLLRFLRPKKFSVHQACDLLEQYLIYRQQFPQWFTKLDPTDPDFLTVLDAGYSFPLLERDEFGRRIFLTAIERFDAEKFSFTQMVRMHAIGVEATLEDEELQIGGFHHCYDARGFGVRHIALWSLTDVNNFLRRAQNIAPMRHRAITVIFSVAHKLIELGLSLLTEKIRSRVRVVKNNDDLQKQIDPKLLPKEYGGTIPMKEMIEAFKAELFERREMLLALDDIEIDMQGYKGKWAVNNQLENDTSVIGSFRKLEVD